MKEKKNFSISILVSIGVSFILSFSHVWQMIIIAGIIAGIFNSSMKRGALSGAAGVGIFWLIFMFYGIITKNSYPLLDQIGTLFIGAGYGWLIFLLILLIGILFGALGGATSSGAMILIKPRLKQYLDKISISEENSEVD